MYLCSIFVNICDFTVSPASHCWNKVTVNHLFFGDRKCIMQSGSRVNKNKTKKGLLILSLRDFYPVPVTCFQREIQILPENQDWTERSLPESVLLCALAQNQLLSIIHYKYFPNYFCKISSNRSSTTAYFSIW